MNLNARIRRIPRWLSLAFTLAVIGDIVAMVVKSSAAWIGFLALVPLIPLLATGLYLFVSPYAAKLRGRRPEGAA